MSMIKKYRTALLASFATTMGLFSMGCTDYGVLDEYDPHTCDNYADLVEQCCKENADTDSNCTNFIDNECACPDKILPVNPATD